MTQREYGLGIVGCGVISTAHATAAAALPQARLAAVTDVDLARAEAFAAAHHGVAEPSLDALLSRDDVDIVSVCVPSGLHAEVGIRAAQAGKHLIIEKPIDVSLAAADRMLAAARTAGVRVTVISQHRFDPGVRELRQLLADGALGRVVLGDARVKWYRSQEYYDSGAWRGTRDLDGGGALINQGIHYADLLRAALGPVESVSALCARTTHDIEGEDVAVAWLRFCSGAVGTLEATTVAFPGLGESLEVSGTGGTVVIENGQIRLRELIAERGPVGPYGTAPGSGAVPGSGAADAAAAGAPGEPDGPDPHMAQIADFLAALDSGREPAVTGQDGRDALEVICAVYESARLGRPVSLPLAAGEQPAAEARP